MRHMYNFNLLDPINSDNVMHMPAQTHVANFGAGFPIRQVSNARGETL